MKRLLIVDDEKDIATTLQAYCRREGWDSDAAHDGRTALELLSHNHYDLAILDLMLPDLSGDSLCRHIKERGQTGVIMLTARVGSAAAIHGLSIGADDYVEKPFSPGELMARIKAVLRRIPETQEATADKTRPALGFSLEKRAVTRDGRALPLTATEWRIVECLAACPGRIYSRAELVDRVLGDDFDGIDRTIDAHVKNLRKKIGDDTGCCIQTVRGLGYRLGSMQCLD